MGPAKQESPGQYAASRQLLILLLRVGLYRDLWEDEARRTNGRVERDRVNQAAVGKVLADYLWKIGERPEGTGRNLKDIVSRAFNKGRLTPEVLDWFVHAFEISPHDTQRLYDMYGGHIELTEIVGSLPPSDAESGFQPPQHKTVLLFEHHSIGREGLPVRHHTQQTISSLIDGLASYQYRIDTNEAQIWVIRGGTPGPVFPLGHNYYATDIAFRHPLSFGETVYLDYRTTFRYTTAPSTEFRRATHRRVEHLDMRIEFHRDKVPRHIWWAEWSGYLDVNRDIVQRKEVTLDEELSAHRYLDAIERTVVGFYWEW